MIPAHDLQFKFRYGQHKHIVEGLSHAICDRCGTSGYLPGQLAENNNRIKAFQKALVKIMGPSDILELRAKYSLSQAQAAKIFGGGANAFSKWERGEVIPNESTAKLLKLALESEAAMESLAKDAGVKLTPDTGSEELLNGAPLTGWLWNKLGPVTAMKNPPRFISFTEISKDCVINDNWYSDESQSAAA